MTAPLDLPRLDLPDDRAERLRRAARAELAAAPERRWVDRIEPVVCVAFAAAYPAWAIVVALGATLA